MTDPLNSDTQTATASGSGQANGPIGTGGFGGVLGNNGLANSTVQTQLYPAVAVVAEVEAKAETIWSKIGDHPVLVVLALCVIAWACVHFVFGF